MADHAPQTSDSPSPSTERGNRREVPPLLAIVGATATGKTALAVSVAEAFGGEIVNTDAYALYRGLDIGTAKPAPELRKRVRHHLIDVAGPDEPLTLARYLDAAHDALDDIWSRGKLPVLAGGSGQYVWALIEGWQVPRVPPDLELRAELEALAAAEGAAAVQARLAAIDPEAAAGLDPQNTRRLIRALEVVTRTGLPLSACQTRQPIDADVLVLGLRLPRDELYRRIDQRAEAQFADGLVEEVQRLRAAGYGETNPLRSGVGYKEVSAYLDGGYDRDEALRRTQNANHRLVRRQHAWFKDTDPRIHWLDAETDSTFEAVALVRDWFSGVASVP
jgi:tRNA dimethylallyltransferase